MRLLKSSQVFDYQLVSRFDELRGRLLTDEFADRLDQPLAYWAVASDRGLPLALMGCSLRELLGTPFEQLYATPGIGQKKLGMLLCLLERALEAEASSPAPPAVDDRALSSEVISDAASRQLPAADGVSEALWVQWRDTVSRHDLGDEILGRFAPNLQKLPRVVWTKPLGAYAKLRSAP